MDALIGLKDRAVPIEIVNAMLSTRVVKAPVREDGTANQVPDESALTDTQVESAIARGTRQPGRMQGLYLFEVDASLLNGLGSLLQQSGKLNSDVEIPSAGFELVVFTPQTWIAQQASDAAKAGATFSRSDVTQQMLQPLLRVLVLPSSPSSAATHSDSDASAVSGVTIADSARRIVIQPALKESITRQGLAGVIAGFSLRDVGRIRTHDPEFFVRVSGPNRFKDFRIKQENFANLPGLPGR